jgi:hypothetical protein
MCLTCTCMKPMDPHGSAENLTLAGLQRAASAAGLPLMESAWSIPATLAAATSGTGDWPPAEDPLTHRPALVWDCDGILSFTSEALCVAMNARFGTTYSPMSQAFFPGTLLIGRLPDAQAAWIAGEMSQPSFVATYAPDFRAIDTLRDAYDAGFECCVATERNPALREATEQWLHDWGGPPVEVNAVGHGNKPAWMAERYGPGRRAVLIDDSPLAQVAIARPGIEVWAPQRPYTPGMPRDHVRVFGSYPAMRYWLGLGPQPGTGVR